MKALKSYLILANIGTYVNYQIYLIFAVLQYHDVPIYINIIYLTNNFQQHINMQANINSNIKPRLTFGILQELSSMGAEIEIGSLSCVVSQVAS